MAVGANKTHKNKKKERFFCVKPFSAVDSFFVTAQSCCANSRRRSEENIKT
jgi:hypothetical protein